MHCPNCRQEIEAGSEFCGNCGARIERHPVELTCLACGSPLLPGAEFCAECGTRLGGEVVPAQSFCPECGATVMPGDTFCVVCGARLTIETVTAQFVCPGCGEPLNPDAAFCGNCGRILQQGAEHAPAAPEAAATENCQSLQPQNQEYRQQQEWVQPQLWPQPQGREWVQDQQQDREQQQLQDWEYSQQQEWVQPQVQSQPQGWESEQAQQQWQAPQQPQSQRQGRSAFSLPQGSGQRKILMAAAAAVILLVIGITGFWKPGFLLDLFRPTAKLENGTLALNDIALDFKQTNLKNGEATLTTVKEKEEEVQNGLIGDLYVMNIDKSCQGKVTVSVPAPKDFKPTTGNGQYIKLGVGRDYTLADGKTARFYNYFDAIVKDGKAVAVIDPAAMGQSRRFKSKNPAKPAEKKTEGNKYIEYLGFYIKNGILQYGEGYQYTKGHFRLWYNLNVVGKKNAVVGADDARKLLRDLELAYNYYKTHGYADHVDTYTPIDVYITRIKSKKGKEGKEEGDEGGWQILTGNIELREDQIFGNTYEENYEGENRTRTRATIYHEVFHAVQQSIIGTKDFLCDSRNSNWFDEATATYFEKLGGIKVSDDNNVKAQFWRLWQGPIPKKSSTEDGYARGLLIEFMSNKLGGDHWIKDCYENWSADYSWFKAYMEQVAPTEADFAAKFYMEVVRSLGTLHLPGYYNACLFPNENAGQDQFLSAIRLEIDDKTKEKIAKGKEDALPVVFTSPSFELAGYGGRVVALVTSDIKNLGKLVIDLTKDFPDKCQLKLEAEGGCRIQVIKFKGTSEVVSSNDIIIKDFKEQINKGYKFLILVTSTKPSKQNVVLKATLEKEQLKEGIYNGRTTMTRGSQSQTADNRVGFRLSKGKDGRWSLNICQANGDNMGSAPNVPLTYDAKRKIWTGHRKFKEELSKDPKKSRAEVSNINCTMKVNTEGKEPILIVDYNADLSRTWGYIKTDGFKVHFEGKWSSELKGKTIKTGKITILE